jgi:hypothetical protein
MNKFKLRMILLFISLLILINMDWFSAPLVGEHALHLTLASISLIVLILEISVPYLRRISSPALTMIWVGTYLFIRAYVISQPELTLIELLIWVYLVVLVQLITQSIDSVDDVIQSAAEAGQSSPAIKLAEAQGLIRAELTRSRHYNRPFSVIAVQFPSVTSDEIRDKVAIKIRGQMVENLVKIRLAKTLRDELRAMDIVLDDNKSGNLLLLCPEVDAQNAEIMIDHLNRVLERDYGFKAAMASASFPDASPTFDGLLDLVNEHLRCQPSVNGSNGNLVKSSSQFSDIHRR